MNRLVRLVRLVVLLPALVGCLRPGDERSASEEEIGHARAAGLAIDVDGGLAHVRRLEPGDLELWAQAPVLAIDLEVDASAAGRWRVAVANALPDAVVGGDLAAAGEAGARPTDRVFELDLAAGHHRVTIGPPDAEVAERFRFAAMADIQTAMDEVDDVFERIGREPGLRFVVSMGDIAQEALPEEYDQFEAQLAALPIPYYTTIGNHDLWEGITPFRERFGRANLHFVFKGVAFSLVDSGNAGIDPRVHGWLRGWLDESRDRVHVFGTHIPPLDPTGLRGGGFRTRAEAQLLLSRLADGDVDLTLYGHIHSYVAYENAGIPAYVSGGGGAKPEKWDGIGRHFLVVDAVPEEDRINSVTLVRVD